MRNPTTEAPAASNIAAAPQPVSSGPTSLVVATPCFGGQISAVYALSLLKLQTGLRDYRDCTLKVLMKDADHAGEGKPVVAVSR